MRVVANNKPSKVFRNFYFAVDTLKYSSELRCYEICLQIREFLLNLSHYCHECMYLYRITNSLIVGGCGALKENGVRTLTVNICRSI